MAPALLSGYGVFTSMQVEAGGVRGLDLHLARLKAGALELFGAAVPEARLRDCMRAAVEGRERCGLRVQLFLPTVTPRRPDARGEPSVLAAAGDPSPPLDRPLRLQTHVYAREAAHLKHAGTFGLTRARRAAVEDDRIVWPDAPMLRGTGQALIERGLATVGMGSESRAIDATALTTFRKAFICNSATPACAVASIDGRALEVDPVLIDRLRAAWATNPVGTI